MALTTKKGVLRIISKILVWGKNGCLFYFWWLIEKNDVCLFLVTDRVREKNVCLRFGLRIILKSEMYLFFSRKHQLVNVFLPPTCSSAEIALRSDMKLQTNIFFSLSVKCKQKHFFLYHPPKVKQTFQTSHFFPKIKFSKLF